MVTLVVCFSRRTNEPVYLQSIGHKSYKSYCTRELGRKEGPARKHSSMCTYMCAFLLGGGNLCTQAQGRVL